MRRVMLAAALALALPGAALAQPVQCAGEGRLELTNWREETSQSGQTVNHRYLVDVRHPGGSLIYGWTVTVRALSGYTTSVNAQAGQGELRPRGTATVVLATHSRSGRHGSPAPMIQTVQQATTLACRRTGTTAVTTR